MLIRAQESPGQAGAFSKEENAQATTIALLVNPTSHNLAEAEARDLQTAAHTLGLQIHVLNASTDRDFDAVFATLQQLKAGGRDWL